jgi:hypothetical protein
MTPRLAKWIAAGAAGSLLCSAGALCALGANQHGIVAALMLTARWAFLLFWPAYAGSGMVALLGGRLGFLKRYGREFGLAFAAAMLVHVGLIAWLCALGDAPATRTFVTFGLGLACIYTLALFSLSGLRRRLGPRSWWLLRTVAMNVIAYDFAIDFLVAPFGGGLRRVALYAPFAVLNVLGMVVYAAGLIGSGRVRILPLARKEGLLF